MRRSNRAAVFVAGLACGVFPSLFWQNLVDKQRYEVLRSRPVSGMRVQLDNLEMEATGGGFLGPVTEVQFPDWIRATRGKATPRTSYLWLDCDWNRLRANPQLMPEGFAYQGRAW